MIIKSSQRGGSKALARHLTKAIDTDGIPQEVSISGSRHLLVGNDVHQALDDMAMMAWASPRTKNHLYHVSLNPSQELTPQQWERAWKIYEQEYGLGEHAFIAVTHTKKGRAHIHRAYERVDTNGKALKLSFTHIRNEKVARILEFELGHDLTIGKHNRAVMQRLKAEGRGDIVAWMEQGRAATVERPVAEKTYRDEQQERRTKVSKKEVKAILQDAWATTQTGQAFAAALAHHNLMLAKGDRRDYVVVDHQGGTHSPRRMLGVKVKELRQQWADLNPQTLPSVADVHRLQQAHLPPKVDKRHPDTALEQLQAAKDATQREIEHLERQLAQQAQTPSPAQRDPLQADHRQLLERLTHWQRIAEQDSERTKPQVPSPWEEAQAWGLSPTTLAVLQTYRGTQAQAERERRLDAALAAAAQEQPPASSPPPSAHQHYQTHLGRWLKAKGRSAYRQADRWLTERLAKYGLSRMQARRILAQASPELMDQQPAQRLSYIRRMVEWVYRRHEQQQQRQPTGQPKSRSPVQPPQQSHPQPRPRSQSHTIPPATSQPRQKTAQSQSPLSPRSQANNDNQPPRDKSHPHPRYPLYFTSAVRHELSKDYRPPYHPLTEPENYTIRPSSESSPPASDLDATFVAALKKAARQSPNSQYQLERAYETLDHPEDETSAWWKSKGGYWGIASREYLKELARQARQKGEKAILTPVTDQDIAVRLRCAGFSWNAINKAITHESPLATALPSVQHQQVYLEKVIKPTLQAPAVRDLCESMTRYRIDNHLAHEQRLDKLKLATQLPREIKRERGGGLER